MGGFLLDEPGARALSDRDAEKRFEQQAEAAKVFDDKFGHLVTQLNRRLEMIMRRLEDVLDVISQQKTKIDSLNALMDAQRAETQRILANAGTSQTTQQLIDQMYDRLQENSGALDAAIAENIDSSKESEQKKEAGTEGKSAAEILEENNKKKAEEIGNATTNEQPQNTGETVFGQPAVNTQGSTAANPSEDKGKSDTSGAPTGPANSSEETAKGNVDQTPPFAADKTQGSTDARDVQNTTNPAQDPRNPGAGSYNPVTGQMDTAGREPVINPATGQPVPGIVAGAPPSDTGNKDLTMPADAGYLGQPGDPATSPAMQQGLSGTGGASNTSDPNMGHQANVPVSDAPAPPVAKDNAIGDEPLKDPSRPVGPVDQNGQPFDEVNAKREAEQNRPGR
jgi:hypothetical protein